MALKTYLAEASGRPLFYYVQEEESGASVAHVQPNMHSKTSRTMDEAKRYADLFAAAPDLLGALKAARAYVTCEGNVDQSGLPIFQQMDGAIAKAEGR